MSNVVINVIPKPIRPGTTSTGKHNERPPSPFYLFSYPSPLNRSHPLWPPSSLPAALFDFTRLLTVSEAHRVKRSI